MNKLYLTVPFSEKDEAKNLGAKWDPDAKKWYVPNEAKQEQFKKWLPLQYEYNLKSDYFYIVKSLELCWRCGAQGAVYTFGLTEYLSEEEPEYWEKRTYPVFCTMVKAISEEAKNAMNRFTNAYRLDFSKKANTTYFMNHCEHCGASLGDFYMYNEPDGAFFPMSDEGLSNIKIKLVDKPFSANANYSPVDYFNKLEKFSTFQEYSDAKDREFIAHSITVEEVMEIYNEAVNDPFFGKENAGKSFVWTNTHADAVSGENSDALNTESEINEKLKTPFVIKVILIGVVIISIYFLYRLQYY